MNINLKSQILQRVDGGFTTVNTKVLTYVIHLNVQFNIFYGIVDYLQKLHFGIVKRKRNSALVQLVRIPDCHSGGRRSESGTHCK